MALPQQTNTQIFPQELLDPHNKVTEAEEERLAGNFGLSNSTDVLEHGTKPRCCIQGKLGHQVLKNLRLQGDKKSSKPDGGGSGWRMEEALGTERDKETQGPSTEGWKGFKGVIKEATSVGDRWMECPKPGLREKES